VHVGFVAELWRSWCVKNAAAYQILPSNHSNDRVHAFRAPRSGGINLVLVFVTPHQWPDTCTPLERERRRTSLLTLTIIRSRGEAGHSLAEELKQLSFHASWAYSAAGRLRNRRYTCWEHILARATRILASCWISALTKQKSDFNLDRAVLLLSVKVGLGMFSDHVCKRLEIV
jgi:hypothetical protein